MRAFCAAAFLAAPLVSSASAHDTWAAAEHTLKFSREGTIERFSGRLASSKTACEAKRPVRLFRITETKPNERIDDGKLKTNGEGKWSVELGGLPSFAPGDYKAIAPKTVVKKQGHKHVCKAAKSSRRTVVAAVDTDEDGWPDSEDCSPQVSNPPGATVCYNATSLYDINQGLFNAGDYVMVDGLVITGISSNGNTVWVQTPVGSPSYEGVQYSAAELDTTDFQMSFGDGSVVNLQGRLATDGSIVPTDLIKTGDVAGPIPHVLTSTDLQTLPTAYHGLLVKLEKETLGTVYSPSSWGMNDGFTVEGSIDPLPSHLPGTWFASVTGIADTRDEVPAVMPRSNDDLVLAATMNETGAANEADFCRLVSPVTLSTSPGEASDFVYAQIFESGVTEEAGADTDVIAQIGRGPNNSDPVVSANGWTFFPADFFQQVGNNDEYRGLMFGPNTPGTYRYTFRFSIDGGASFTYCDNDGAGSGPSADWSVSNTGTWTIEAS